MENEKKYPKNYLKFFELFKDEDACRKYLFNIRWPNGFCCPNCNNVIKIWFTAQNLIHCGICGHQTSLTSSTLYHGSRKPLLMWFQIIWMIVAQKTGVSASNLKDFMGFGSYKTAWTWLQKIRRVMTNNNSEKLFGTIEVGKIFIRGLVHGLEEKKVIEAVTVVVVAERNGNKIGNIRFRCMDTEEAADLQNIIQDNIRQGSTVITNGEKEYSFLSLEKSGYFHEVSVSGNKTNASLLHIRTIDIKLKRWLLGTHQDKVSLKYLPFYLDEFAYRFNGRMSTPGELFYNIILKSIEIGKLSKSDIVEQAT